MKCPRCGEEMTETVYRFFTMYKCPVKAHSPVYVWDEMFTRSKEE